MHVDSHGIAKFGRGDAVATGDLERQADVSRPGRRNAGVPDDRRHEQCHGDRDDARAPLPKLADETVSDPRRVSSIGKTPAMKKTKA